MLEKFEVGVVGAGYVGLVTGASLAHIRHRVTLVDKDVDKIAVPCRKAANSCGADRRRSGAES